MATLRQTFSDIASAIRAKGVSGTMKPIEMAQKIGEIQNVGYLTFTAEEDTTLTLVQNGNITPHKLLKSTDGVNWTKWENTSTNGIVLKAGESVYIKADEDALNKTATGDSDYNNFQSTGPISCSGDIMSIVNLLNSDYYCFLGCLFRGMENLTHAPELKPMTSIDRCYSNMFDHCKSLIKPPSVVYVNSCEAGCNGMFYNCTSLKRIKMNASSGSWGESMFNGCTSLELVDMTGSTGVPQLENVNNFDNTNDTYKIVVPASLYDTWVNETNWASIASHIMKQSDWNNEHPDDILGQQ